ncbi:MAG: hypothetical protein C0407_09155 [Desulfobacca sp.]|nr:hypothetical protein [Desulfobacca sp.]
MTPAMLRAKIISEQSAWMTEMITRLRCLPLDSLEIFQADPRNPAAAESYLRRALEALFDLGRHVLAKGFGQAVSEYKEISRALVQRGVLSQEEGERLIMMAGYRNRMVHFYQEISVQELYEICTKNLGDIQTLLASIRTWVKSHPEMVNQAL